MLVQIDVAKVAPGDGIILTFDDSVDFDEMNSIVAHYRDIFPQNTIIPNNNYMVKDITVIEKHPERKMALIHYENFY